MSFTCSYCNRLKKGLKGHNYCSNNSVDSIRLTKSNSFYLTSNQMYSGNHISRLSIRGVLNGYQYYKIGKTDKVVKKDNYLVVNEGQKWFSEIEAERPVEMLVVAFHPDFIDEGIYGLATSPEKMLDEPFTFRKKELTYFENTYPNDEKIARLFAQLKKGILLGLDELFFDQVLDVVRDVMGLGYG